MLAAGNQQQDLNDNDATHDVTPGGGGGGTGDVTRVNNNQIFDNENGGRYASSASLEASSGVGGVGNKRGIGDFDHVVGDESDQTFNGVGSVGIGGVTNKKRKIRSSNCSSASECKNSLMDDGVSVVRGVGDSMDQGGHCRVDNNDLPIDLFAIDTCAQCYFFMRNDPGLFLAGAKWNKTVVKINRESRIYNVHFLRFNDTVVSSFAYSHIILQVYFYRNSCRYCRGHASMAIACFMDNESPFSIATCSHRNE